MAKTGAWQLQKADIRVNSICPGLIETGMTGETFEFARKRGTERKIGQLNPLGRAGVPEGTLCDLYPEETYNTYFMLIQKLHRQLCF